MLEIRPNCELCDRDLPVDSGDARICTYECTFCCDCVDDFLHNVCPNCGGGLVTRPIRPAVDHRKGVSRVHQPVSQERIHNKYSRDNIEKFVAGLRDIDIKNR